MRICIDFHVHSDASPDGRMTLPEIREAAVRRGLHGVAVCDHDRVFRGADDPDFLWIAGVECTTEYGHLLGLFVDGPVPEGTFAQKVQAIHACGGIAVLAHPMSRGGNETDFAAAMETADGVEVWNARANRRNRQANDQARAMAARYHCVITAGSDAHLPCEIGNGFLILEAEKPTAESVKEALLRGRIRRVEGQESACVHTARSQWIKLKKTRGSVLAYGKWFLFFGKCAICDLVRRKKKISVTENSGGSSCLPL